MLDMITYVRSSVFPGCQPCPRPKG